jgi:hypothetical protein
MKPSVLVMALGGFMILMGIVGYIRTGSPTAIFINGGIALVTVLLGYFMGRGNPMLANVTLGWVGLVTVILSFMTVKRINAAMHGTAREGSEYIFGSMALFALIVLIVLIRSRMNASGS